MPRFSVIVPLYNVEDFVGECIDSLSRQSFDDFEVVCVDDASTDSTLSVARRAAGSDDRFVFVERPENGGLSAARNTGLQVATGQYVSFLDSDDRYDTCALEHFDAVLSKYDLDLLDFSASTFYDTDSSRRAHEESYDYRDEIDGVLGGQELFVAYWERVQFVSSACFHVIKRELLDKAGLRFCEGLLHEDELFTPQLYAAAQRAMFLDEQLYERRIRSGSIMTSPATMHKVRSLVAISTMLHAWLLEHASSLDIRFIDAFALDIAYVRDAAFSAIQRVDERELLAYLDQLSPAERIDFDLVARYGCAPARQREQWLIESRDFRIGHALLAGPRALRSMKR